MTELVFAWWAWAIAGLIMAILEIVAPAFVLLGFAIGAGAVAVILLLGGASLICSASVLFLVFAVISLLSWLILRRVFQLKTGQVKIWDTDINE